MRVETSFIHAGKRSYVTYVVPVVVVVGRRRRRRQPYIDENQCIPRVSVLSAGPLMTAISLLFPRLVEESCGMMFVVLEAVSPPTVRRVH